MDDLVWMYECKVCKGADHSASIPLHAFWWRHRHGNGLRDFMRCEVKAHRDGSRSILLPTASRRVRFNNSEGVREVHGRKIRTWIVAKPFRVPIKQLELVRA